MALVQVFNPTTITAFSGLVTVHTDIQLSIQAIGGSLTQTYTGTGFQYSGTSVTSGTVTGVSLSDVGGTYYTITGLSVSAVTVASYVTSGDSVGLSNFLLGGPDTVNYFSGFGAAIFGYAGNDTINGGSGDDTLDGGSGADNMSGGAGNDTYIVDLAGDVVNESAGNGNDTVQTSISGYVLGTNLENLTLTGAAAVGFGNAGDNLITGNAANNTLSGSGGNDTFDGGAGVDSMFGGTGDDTYIVDSAADAITDGGGNDTVVARFNGYTLSGNDLENLSLAAGVVAALTGNGNGNANRLTGNEFNNSLSGNGGDDTLDGGAGVDTLAGGSGDDTYIVDSATDTLVELAGGGVDTVQSSASITLAAQIEKLVLTGSLAIDGAGNILDNLITGNAANNLLDGGAGADTLQGGAGDDTYIVDNAGDTVNESAGNGNDTVQTSISGYSLGSDIENLLLTGTAAQGFGNAGDNRITGNAANNALSGNDGNDTLDGGAGSDTLEGGAGDDTYIVDAATDLLVEAANGGTDTVRSSIAWVLGAGFERLVLTGSAAISATGNALDNLITGNDANNTIDGGAGADAMNGGAGDDIYIVDNAGDTASEDPDSGSDEVRAAVNHVLGNNIENLLLTGSANLDGGGNALANLITGNAGNNHLAGAGGNDTLAGGAGADTMSGGDGDDTYFVTDSGDVVIEFSTLLAGARDQVFATASFVLSSGVEQLTLQGNAAINGTGSSTGGELIIGNDAANRLEGGGGRDDELRGLGGDDTLVQTAGVGEITRMLGGGGNDTYVLADNFFYSIVENPGEGIDTVLAAGDFTLPDNFENLTLVLGNNGSGNSAANVITGNDAASNILDGKGGADTMIGGGGIDIYYVDNPGDVVIELANGGNDAIVTNGIGYSLAGTQVEELTLGGPSFVTDADGTGNELANQVFGTGGRNRLDGGTGIDELRGFGGDDTYVVDNSADQVIEAAGEGNDTVQASASFTLGVGVENLQLTGSAAIDGSGNDLANRITGNAAANQLAGGGGADTLDGGGGADTLRGGGGADLYIVDNAGDVVIETAGDDPVRASESSNGLANDIFVANGDPSASGDGRLVVFTSGSRTLTPNDFNGANDILLKDLLTGSLTLLSTSSNGFGSAFGVSSDPEISANGRYVVFTSSATDLLAGQSPYGDSYIYVKDLQTGAVDRVSTKANDGLAGGGAFNPSMSADGRMVAFESAAANMVPGDTNFLFDIYVKDRTTRALTWVSTDAAGNAADDASANARISADGLRVVFDSLATNLVSGDLNGTRDIFVKTLAGGAIVRASTSAAGTEGNGDSARASLSADGRYVLFESTATNLVAGDTNGASDIFLKDLVSGAVQRLSIPDLGLLAMQANGESVSARLSDDGRFAVFVSSASNLTFGDTNNQADIFVKDLATGAIARVSDGLGGAPANSFALTPAFSGDGRFVVFASLASNLASVDTNQSTDIFRVANPFTGGGPVDVVQASVSWTLPNYVETLTLTGSAAIDGTGNDQANLITGNGAANRLRGNGGDDTLDGGAGIDSALYANVRAAFTITRGNGGFQVNHVGFEGKDFVRNVEYLRFADTSTLLASLASNAGIVDGFGGWRYLASNPGLVGVFGLDADAATRHYIDFGWGENRSFTSFKAALYLASNPGLISVFGSDLDAASEHYLRFGFAEGRPTAGFDTLRYLASNPTLISSLGFDAETIAAHYVQTGFNGHLATTSFNGYRYLDSNPGLLAFFGPDAAAATDHYLHFGYSEGRSATAFDPYEYLASNPALISPLSASADAASEHYAKFGHTENRPTTAFSVNQYLATNQTLIPFFTGNSAAAIEHFVKFGYAEGRPANGFFGQLYLASNPTLIDTVGHTLEATATHYVQTGYAQNLQVEGFNPLQYLASNLGLLNFFGPDAFAAIKHYIDFGYHEGRPVAAFDGLEYIASNPGLIPIFGANADAGIAHYVYNGVAEGRPTISFNAQQYHDNYGDLEGKTLGEARTDFISGGLAQGRGDAALPLSAGATAGPDNLSGSSGADSLSGGTGADTLNGGLGNDTLTGGYGADQFVFNTTLDAATNLDRVIDFTHGVDKLLLDQAIFALPVNAGALAADNFASNATGSALDGDDFVVYNNVTGVLSYDADGNGGGAPIAFANLASHPLLTAADFTVI